MKQYNVTTLLSVLQEVALARDSVTKEITGFDKTVSNNDSLTEKQYKNLVSGSSFLESTFSPYSNSKKEDAYYFFHSELPFVLWFNEKSKAQEVTFASGVTLGKPWWRDYESYKNVYKLRDSYDFEEVGHSNLPQFFQKVVKILKTYSNKSGNKKFTFVGSSGSSTSFKNKKSQVERQLTLEAGEKLKEYLLSSLTYEESTTVSDVLEKVQKANEKYSERLKNLLQSEDYVTFTNQLLFIANGLNEVFLSNLSKLPKSTNERENYTVQKDFNVFKQSFEKFLKKFNKTTVTQYYKELQSLKSNNSTEEFLKFCKKVSINSFNEEFGVVQEAIAKCEKYESRFLQLRLPPVLSTYNSNFIAQQLVEEPYALVDVFYEVFCLKLLEVLRGTVTKLNQTNVSTKELLRSFLAVVFNLQKEYSVVDKGLTVDLKKLVTSLAKNPGYKTPQQVTLKEFLSLLQQASEDLVTDYQQYVTLSNPEVTKKVLRNLQSELSANWDKSTANLEALINYLDFSPLTANSQNKKKYNKPGQLVTLTSKGQWNLLNEREKLYYTLLIKYGIPESNITVNKDGVTFKVE